VHCAVLWRRQFRAFSERWQYMDSLIVNEHHTMHCSQFLIDITSQGPEALLLSTRVKVGFGGCHVRGNELFAGTLQVEEGYICRRRK